MMILLLGLIIVGVVYAAGGFRGGPMRRPEDKDRDRALEILQERYARGEIDSKEYEEKKRALAS